MVKKKAQRVGKFKIGKFTVFVSEDSTSGTDRPFCLTIMKNGSRFHREHNETAGECYRKALSWIEWGMEQEASHA